MTISSTRRLRQQGTNGVRSNNAITAKEVRLVDSNGEQMGIFSIEQALEAAREAGLDLVEISPKAQPPVCRIMDQGKFLFEKKAMAKKQKQAVTKLKEIRFRPGTEEGDYQVKLRNLVRFLQQGNKVKVTIRFRGREMAYQDQGRELLSRVEADTQDVGIIEQRPSFEGRQMIMLIGPQRSKGKN